MATLLKLNGAETEVQPENGKYFTLKELQGFVGGYIEVIPVAGAINDVLVVNEEGYQQNLRPNVQASGLAGLPLVGDALLCTVQEID